MNSKSSHGSVKVSAVCFEWQQHLTTFHIICCLILLTRDAGVLNLGLSAYNASVETRGGHKPGNGGPWRFMVYGVSWTINLREPFCLTDWVMVHDVVRIAKAFKKGLLQASPAAAMAVQFASELIKCLLSSCECCTARVVPTQQVNSEGI